MATRSLAVAVAALALLGAAPAAAREPAPAAAWLDTLEDELAADLRAGRPAVVHAHVALCDNTIIRCGGRSLGDGDSLRGNLYWATAEGFRGFFDGRRSGWTRVAVLPGERPEVLERVVWRRRVAPGAALRRRGVVAPFEVYVVADAWRGRAIDAAVVAYLDDLFGARAREVRLPGGAVLRAGGAAHAVAWVGHNRWMDTPAFDWGRFSRRPRPPRAKGVIAIACHTRAYLRREVAAPGRVPLLFTADFLFASAPAFAGAVTAFAAGGGYAEIRAAATRGYAAGQRQPLARVGGVFTNPADRRWTR